MVGGTAGCALASMLSKALEDHQVLLLEAGGTTAILTIRSMAKDIGILQPHQAKIGVRRQSRRFSLVGKSVKAAVKDSEAA